MSFADEWREQMRKSQVIGQGPDESETEIQELEITDVQGYLQALANDIYEMERFLFKICVAVDRLLERGT
jgi:hypothetical protein